MIDGIEMSKCFGCKMCADVCPKNAITFSTNNEGFWYPQVDSVECIKCGKCLKVCPIKNKNYVENNKNTVVYAAWSRNDDIRRESTSGGLYYEFAAYVLNQMGYIVGSVYSDDFCSAYHTYTDSFDGLNRIMGSKYFQSDTEGIYKQTEKLLKTGKLVLFAGTPCQVVALKNYLDRDFDNLITIDFICRGVPSPAMQKKKIELYERKSGSKVISYRDKSKYKSWCDFGEFVKFKNGKKKFISRWNDDINNCFIEKNLNLRESCYKCTLKDGNCCSDITIGDFWGISGVTEHDMELGVSAMLINSVKGDNLIKQIKSQIYVLKRNIENLKTSNPAYVESVKRPDDREKFFDMVENKGLEKTVKHFTKRNVKEMVNKKKIIIKSALRPYRTLIKEFKYINWFKFIRYNFFCKAIKRKKNAFLIPCYGAVIKISKTANVEIYANVLINHYPCYKRGSQTTLFQVGDAAVVVFKNRVEIAYGNTLSINSNAKFETGYFYTGVGANVICNHNIKIGNNVMFGRDVCLFDSDYHIIRNIAGEYINEDKKVVIEDNVWIGARSMVLKGAHISEGAIVSANSMVTGDVEPDRVFINKRETKSIGNEIYWER